MQKIGIKINEFKEIMKLTVKTFRDNTDNKKIITYIYKTCLYLKKMA